MNFEVKVHMFKYSQIKKNKKNVYSFWKLKNYYDQKI